MAEQDTGKRMRADEDNAPSKAHKGDHFDVAMNAKLLDAMQDVTEFHHKARLESIHLQLLELRADLADLQGRPHWQAPPTRPDTTAALFDELHGKVAAFGTAVSSVLSDIANMRYEQREDVRRVLWGVFPAYPEAECTARLFRLLKLWLGKNYHVIPSRRVPGVYRVEELGTGKEVAAITQDGKVQRFGTTLVDFSTHCKTWVHSNGL